MRKFILMMALSPLIGLAPAMGMAGDAPASVSESKTASDLANIALVKAFVAAWNDPDHAAQYLSDKAVVRMEENKPALVGRRAYADAVKPYLALGQHFSVRYLEIFARGPLVVTRRIDTIEAPGKTDAAYELVGVFVVKDGKIIEWSDFAAK